LAHVPLAACKTHAVGLRGYPLGLRMGQRTLVACQPEICQVKHVEPCPHVPCSTDACANIDSISELQESVEVQTKGPFGRIDEANCSLIRASREGNVQGIKQALSNGADINARLPTILRMLTSDDDEMQIGRELSSLTALMHASNEGNKDALKFLLSSRAQVDLEETDGLQAIHFAAQAGCAKCFQELLDAGANPLAKDDFDNDALTYVPLDAICRTAARDEWLPMLKELRGKLVPVATGHAMEQTNGHDAVVVYTGDVQNAEAITDADVVPAAKTAVSADEHGEAKAAALEVEEQNAREFSF